LPRGFSTNGAIVEGGSNIIVSSASSTMGYYRFDLNTLEAEKVSESENVFNASDLANANLVSEKKKMVLTFMRDLNYGMTRVGQFRVAMLSNIAL
jgi:hypothetical protein